MIFHMSYVIQSHWLLASKFKEDRFSNAQQAMRGPFLGCVKEKFSINASIFQIKTFNTKFILGNLIENNV